MLPPRAWALCLFLLVRAIARGQPPQPVQEQPQESPVEEYFSGTVVAYAEESVTVARTVLGKNSAPRRFVISPDTQIEGKLKVKCRVTVQYITKDDVDRALYIIVRAPTSPPRK